MTRLEAIKKIRKGERLEVMFTPETHPGVSQGFIIMMYYVQFCDFPREKQQGHDSGPIHCMFFSGMRPFWIHITPHQVLGFIRRNYPRNYPRK
jgi:hypothetical protein